MKFIREFRRLRQAQSVNRDVKARLDGLMGVSNTIAAWVSFWLIAQWSLDFPDTLTRFSVFDRDLYASDFGAVFGALLDAGWSFVHQKWPYLILAVFTWWWFTNYRRAVETEIDIVLNVFHESHRPKRWERVADRKLYAILSVMIVATFLALAGTLHWLELYCAIVMGLWLQDTLGNASIRRNLRRYLDDTAYHLPDDHPDRPYYERKRDIARAYWVDRPHLERIAVLIFLTVLVLMSALSQEVFGVDLPAYIPTGLMSAIILGNELTVKSWRQTRDADLLEAEAEHDARLAGTEPT